MPQISTIYFKIGMTKPSTYLLQYLPQHFRLPNSRVHILCIKIFSVVLLLQPPCIFHQRQSDPCHLTLL